MFLNTTPFEANSSRNILMSPNSFLTLRNNLIKNIGTNKTNGFLFHFGKEMGEAAAKEYFENHPSSELRKPRGKRTHVLYGHVNDIIYEENLIRNADGSIKYFHGVGKWIDSFEARVHLQNHGPSSVCVCHTISGFVSGAMSYEFGKSIITLETKCVAKGDTDCEFEIRLEEDWLSDKKEILTVYQDGTILSELEMTYEGLLHHKDTIEKISTFHNKLTQGVTDRNSMDEVIQSAYEILSIPTLIEDMHGNQLLQIGFTEEQLQRIKQEKQKLNYEEKIHNSVYYKGPFYSKLVSPVLINKKHYGTCSLYYFSPNHKDANDHLYLEIISTITALCLLYETAQYEEQVRMKFSFLDRLIHKQYHSIKDLELYFKFLPFNFQPPFSTAVINISKKHSNDQLVDFYDQMLHFSRLFNQYTIPSVFAIAGEQIVLLNAQHENKKELREKLSLILNMMEKHHKNYQYSIGVSNTFNDFAEFETSLKEARIAQKFPNKQRNTSYEDLGILGDFVTNMSQKQLHEMAKNMLKDLYDFQNPRKKDLLYTLYRYLSNGQKLKETMEELSLSIGGIQYRIKQIEAIIEKNLKNASNAAYLLLMIEALILLGELQFDE